MKCKFCNITVEEPIFDIGDTAIFNDLITENMLNSLEKTYPLVLYVCPQCLLAQTAQYRMGMKFLVMIMFIFLFLFLHVRHIGYNMSNNMFIILLKGLLCTKECIKRRLSFDKLRYEISNVWALSRQ
tara:strand:- start:198 stop:578 length:381 start_codon:yes stop_codon:yes gene_type:complete